MIREQEPIQLIRHAIATHIKDVAQELIYWMEELNRIEAEIKQPGAARPVNARANA